MMIELLIFCLCCSLACLAIYVMFNWQGMIFYEANFKSYSGWQAFLRKPIYGCLTCMASVWGTIFYWTSFDAVLTVKSWILCVLIISGINTLICLFLEKHSDYGC